MERNIFSSLSAIEGMLTMSVSPESKCNIMVISIECDSENPNLQEITLTILGLPNEKFSTIDKFERVSPTEWQREFIIDLPDKIDELTFIASSSTSGDLGYLTLTESKFEGIRRSSQAFNCFKCAFEVEAGSPALALSLQICKVPGNEGEDADNFHSNVMATAAIRDLDTEFAIIGTKPYYLKAIAELFTERFDQNRNKSDLDNAISAYDRAIHLLPMYDPHFLDTMYGAGIVAIQRFDISGNLSDIDQAISMLEIVVSRTKEDDSNMRRRLNGIGDAFFHRFRRTGNVSDISEAMSHSQKALSITPDGDPNLPNQLNRLGRSYLHYFHHTGDIADLSRAISTLQNAIHHASADNRNLPDMLNHLGNAYLRHFEETEELLDISEAISSLQKAVHLTSESHPGMATRLNDLGLAYECRFGHTGDLEDLSEAILAQQNAVRLTSEDNQNLPDRLNNLGISYLQRFDRIGNFADIAESISALQKAVEFAPWDHPNIPGHLNNLGNSYMRRYEHGKDAADLSKAIAAHKKAVDLLHDDHPNKPALLNSLAMSYSWRSHDTGSIDDISEQISITQKAVDLTPEGHVDLPSRLINLAITYLQRSQAAEDVGDIFEAASQYRKAATSIPGNSLQRLKAAKGWAELAQLLDPSNVEEILYAYDIAIQLIPQIASLEHTIRQRHSDLLSVSDLSNKAAAAAFNLGRPEIALSWLEQGRCFVWNQINNLRTPIDDLHNRNPNLADRFIKTANTHIKLARERAQLLSQIRNFPEFENFLRPPTAADILQNLPSAGPVVVINVHEDRCDALALLCGNDTPIHIPLETFTYKQADRLRTELRSLLKSNGVRMREAEDRSLRTYVRGSKKGDVLQNILQELWTCVVKPVLNDLAFSPAISDLPRIWWCATGPLAFLPLHAAGIWGQTSKQIGSSLSEYAVSSYTPTVTALTERIKATGSREDDVENGNKLLMISQPNTPGLPPIPGTRREVDAIQKRLKKDGVPFTCLEESSATVKRVFSDLDVHHCVHLACHAIQDPEEPLRSGFHLYDGRMELSQILKKQLPKADFAFLSACQTSAGDEKLSEEAVHLAAGMLASGYRGVVATMWSIMDSYGPQIAEDFYDNLLGASENKIGITGASAAHALHYASKRMRERQGESEHSLLAWVPYVHFGL
ncbi:CHAT domain-containing protein [Gymnopilus junonius]|uniref:CHAT domain-containing protein n=1 Tax=Gymnopilus junonius TaxID=109634 RepID=A0A9P5TFJ1_GYMJU|nr:CHAT domain-containing protein [Gymnopilus junonius]